jgi:rhombotail lipoprotein
MTRLARWKTVALMPLLLGGAACVRPAEHVRHGAPVAPVVLRHARPATDGAAPVSRPQRLGVAVARESMLGRTGGVFGNTGGTHALGPADRDAVAQRVAALLRQQPALRGTEVVVLPDGVERLAGAELRARHGIDALCMVGYEQTQRTSNGPLLLLELALLVPPFVLPTMRGEAATTLDLIAVRLDDGRALFHGGSTSRVHGRAVPMFAESHAHDLRVRGLHDAVAALGAELPRILTDLDDAPR